MLASRHEGPLVVFLREATQRATALSSLRQRAFAGGQRHLDHDARRSRNRRDAARSRAGVVRSGRRFDGGGTPARMRAVARGCSRRPA